MKKIFFYLMFVAFFAGCSSHNSVVLPQNRDMGNNANVSSYVYVADIDDKRENPNLAGVIKNRDGSVSDYVLVDKNFSQWFKAALSNELKRRNLGITDDISAADAVIYTSIAKFGSELMGFGEENLKGECEIFYTIKSGKTTYTKRVAQTQSEFKIIKTADAFTPFTQNLLQDVITKSAKVIAQTLR